MATHTGGSAAAGPTTGAPSAQLTGTGGQSSDAPTASNTARAKDVEVIDRDGASLGTFDGQGQPLAPNIIFATSERSADSATQQTSYFVVKEYRSPDDEQGVTHTFPSLEEAISKAEALGKTHLDSFDEHGDWHPVSKGADGAWTHRQTEAKRISADIERDQVATTGGTPPKPAPERSGEFTPNQATALEVLKAVLKERGDSDKQIATVAAVAVERFQRLRKELGLEPVLRVYDRPAPRPATPAQPVPAWPLAHERSR